jgi:hypothetical protein
MGIVGATARPATTPDVPMAPHRYRDTVFDDGWVERTLGTSPGELADLVGAPPGGRL